MTNTNRTEAPQADETTMDFSIQLQMTSLDDQPETTLKVGTVEKTAKHEPVLIPRKKVSIRDNTHLKSSKRDPQRESSRQGSSRPDSVSRDPRRESSSSSLPLKPSSNHQPDPPRVRYNNVNEKKLPSHRPRVNYYDIGDKPTGPPVNHAQDNSAVTTAFNLEMAERQSLIDSLIFIQRERHVQWAQYQTRLTNACPTCGARLVAG